MNATSRDIAEKHMNKLAESLAAPFGTHLSCAAVHMELIADITAALEEAERAGYERGCDDAAKIGEQFEIQDEVSSRIRALKDVKP